MTMNKVDYFEIGTTSPDETKRFYSELFGRHIGPPSPARHKVSSPGGTGDNR